MSCKQYVRIQYSNLDLSLPKSVFLISTYIKEKIVRKNPLEVTYTETTIML